MTASIEVCELNFSTKHSSLKAHDHEPLVLLSVDIAKDNEIMLVAVSSPRGYSLADTKQNIQSKQKQKRGIRIPYAWRCS